MARREATTLRCTRPDIAQAIIGVWKSILGRSGPEPTDIGPKDNFFDLGGHSLLAMQVVFRVEKEVGPQVHPMELLLNSLEQFADLCDRRKGRSDAADTGLLGRLRQRLSGGRRSVSRTDRE